MPFRPGWSGGRGGYNPIYDADLDLIELWQPGLGMSLSGALVNSCTGQKHGHVATAAGGLRSTYATGGIVDIDGNPHPAFVFAGAQGFQCTTIGAALAGRATVDVMFGAQMDQAFASSLGMVCELGGPFSLGDGRFLVLCNDTNPSSIEGGMHYVGTGYWRTAVGECPLADPGVVEFNLGGGANGTTLHTLDGVSMLGADVANSMVVPASIANETLYIGSRANTSLFMNGALGPFMLIGGAATEAAKLRARLWLGAQIGALQA